jgi:hypothetical protein
MHGIARRPIRVVKRSLKLLLHMISAPVRFLALLGRALPSTFERKYRSQPLAGLLAIARVNSGDELAILGKHPLADEGCIGDLRWHQREQGRMPIAMALNGLFSVAMNKVAKTASASVSRDVAIGKGTSRAYAPWHNVSHTPAGAC